MNRYYEVPGWLILVLCWFAAKGLVEICQLAVWRWRRRRAFKRAMKSLATIRRWFEALGVEGKKPPDERDGGGGA